MATAVAVLPALAPLQPVQPAAAAQVPASAASSAAVPSAGAGAPSDDDADPDGTPLVISEITPEAVREESTVTVAGRISNVTEEPLGGVEVQLTYNRYPLIDRGDLDAHADGDFPAPNQTGPTATIDGDLPPGASAPFELEIDAEDMDLSGGFGVYPLTVEAVSESAGDLGTERTFLPYTGDTEDIRPLNVAWVWPLMDQPQRADDDTYLDGSLAEALAEDGRLATLLSVGSQDGEIDPAYTGPGTDPEDPDATQTPETPETPSPEASPSASPSASPGGEEQDSAPRPEEAPSPADPVPITWAVDPGLLDDIRRLSASGYQTIEDTDTVPAEPGGKLSLEEHEASTEALVWLAHAQMWLAEDALLATPYSDTDIAALLEADLKGDAEKSLAIGRDTVAEILEREADPALAWPAHGTMDGATRDFLAVNGATHFILNDSALPAQRWLGYTPTAAASLPVPDRDDATALVADSGLTRELGADSWEPGAATLARQRFAAETAMITSERPGTERTVVLAPPRDWNPSPEYAAGLLEATDGLPWLEPVPLTEVEPDSAGTDSRQELTYPEDVAGSELSDGYLDQVRGIRRQAELFNSALTEDDDPFRPAILRLESAWWREEEAALAATARARVAETVRGDKASVHVIPGDPITLASKNGTLGILVANDLDSHSVTVHLSIFSENSERLSIGEYTKSMEIGPGGKTTVYVPLSARVNGRTVLHMSLHNADGEPLTEEQTMLPVNVTGLGTSALIISAAAALVLVAALAPRAVRKWVRERTRAVEAASSGPGPEPDGAERTDTEGPGPADGGGADPMHHNGRGPAETGPDGTGPGQNGQDKAGPAETTGPAAPERAAETVGVEGTGRDGDVDSVDSPRS